ncbi:MAG: hypothetical protein ACK4VM_18415 [Bosea sp. (in: a-proteobacteria)]
MVKILLLISYLMTTGDVVYDLRELKVDDLTSCRTYAKSLARQQLPEDVRDMHVQCLGAELKPLRGARGA